MRVDPSNRSSAPYATARTRPTPSSAAIRPAARRSATSGTCAKSWLPSPSRYERVADRIAGFVGKPQFIALHALWFLVWVAINTGLFAIVARFDDYPFGLLGIVLSVEAIFITGFLLISQNRQSAHADKRAELDYEVNVRTYRELHDIDTMLRTILARLDRLESPVRG